MRRAWLIMAMLLASPAAATGLTGINLAGAEFGGIRGVYGKAYTYPDAADMRSFRDLGMNVFRIPARWERLQPVLSGELDPAELARLDTAIRDATGMGATVIVDVHNYARYARETLGGDAVPAAALTDLWRRLAQRYKSNDQVAFGLMNEPVRISAGDWAKIASDTVAGIRATGARNLILVPGTNWSGAHSWRKPAGDLSNAAALAGFSDPGRNFAFDIHQYFDGNSSGTSPQCVSPEDAVRRLNVATAWLRETGHRGFLSEFGVAASPECQAVLRAALTHLAANREWLGWTIWASSRWFGNYPFNIDPRLQPPPPQLATLRPFLAPPR